MTNVKDYGAVGDGIADDTTAIQTAIGESDDEVIFPTGTYRVNGATGIRIPSHRTLALADDAVITAPNVAPKSRVIETIPDATGIRIHGGVIRGSRDNVTGLQWGIGLRIDSANDVAVERTWFTDAFWDCVWIGGNTPSSAIVLRRVTCETARRSGMSITHASGVLIQACTFQNSSGQEPECGTNIEPNANESVDDVTILDSTFSDCRIGLYIHKGQGLPAHGISVFGCSFIDNSQYGLIGTEVDGLKVFDCAFCRSKWGASLGGGSSCVTFADNMIDDCEHALVLAGVEHPRIYGNACGTIELIQSGAIPGVYGKAYVDTTED